MSSSLIELILGIIMILFGIIVTKTGGGTVKGYPITGDTGILIIAFGAIILFVGLYKLYKNRSNDQ